MRSGKSVREIVSAHVAGGAGIGAVLGAAVTVATAGCIAGGVPAARAAGFSPTDGVFVAQTFLGNRFQIDSGRLAETSAADTGVRAYGQLMDTSHVAVENRLVAVLGARGLPTPPAPLLAGAYASLVRMLAAERGAAFDRDYVASQVDYQRSNDALYRGEIAGGADPALVAFARETLPKIDDHLGRAQALAAALRSRSG